MLSDIIIILPGQDCCILTEPSVECIMSLISERRPPTINDTEYNVQIRPMVLLDLKDIFYTVHQKIKAVDTSATYQGFTVEHIFGMETGEGEAAERPNILEVARLIDLSLVAEIEGTPCGFIVGRQTYLAEHDTLEGEIVVIGVTGSSRKGYRRQAGEFHMRHVSFQGCAHSTCWDRSTRPRTIVIL